MLSFLGVMACRFGGGYQSHVALSLLLLALCMGFLVAAKAKEVDCSKCKLWGSIVAWFVMIVAILGLTCMGLRCAGVWDGGGKSCAYSKKLCSKQSCSKSTPCTSCAEKDNRP